MASLRLVPYGPQAALALRDAVRDAKAGDPLAPVTVAVPSNYASLSLRRRLGAAELSLDGRPGFVNVRFIVLARIAELLGAPALAAQGRRPLTNPVRAEATRAALTEDPGPFRDVFEHGATERSVESTFRDLRQATPQALDVLSRQGPRAAAIVRLFRRFRELTRVFYDEEDLCQTAASAVRAGSPALRDVGHVILFLPRRLSPAELALVEALAGEGGLTALVGLAGEAVADEPARALAARLESTLGPPDEVSLTTPGATTSIVAVSDAEEEVRSALRLVMERLATGTPLHRIAVLYPTTQPYALLAHEQFRAAEVPHNGPSVRTLAQTLSGRTLLGLLRLREGDFRRDAVFDWLSGAPVLERANGHPAPAHRWDTLSRAANIVGGAPQWRERLARHGRSIEQRRSALERRDDLDEWVRNRIEADLDHVQRLAAFVDDLATQTQPGRRSTWADFAAWGRELLERYLGGEGHRSSWPVEELEAHRSVEAALDALSTLGDVRQRTDEATFRRALERELEAPAGRVGRFGAGVFIGRLRDAMGTDFDLIIVLGMTEGLMPPRPRDDPLLPDRERAVAGEDMPLRTDRQAEHRRDYLAALAGAPERLLVYPRADLRGQRGRLPAQWLLAAASQLEGRTLYSADLDPPPARPWLSVVPSFEGALASEAEPGSEQEYTLRSMLGWRRGGRNVLDHHVVVAIPRLHEGIGAEIARAGTDLTRWDGRLEPHAAPVPSAERPVSPTALQHWAACPFRYLLGHVLYVAETEKPEDTLTLTPIERGNLVHRALETFISEMPERTSPGEPWSGAERARLLEIGDRLCDEAESAGITGRPLLWRLERARLLQALDGFLDDDEALRAKHGVIPADVELAFGMRDSEDPAVLVPVDGGRSLAFRGRIDRVDRAPDGGKLVVLDYKTGTPNLDMYKKLHVQPVSGGKLLQLPVYALAARQHYGDVPAEAYYWFVRPSEYERRGYPLEAQQLDEFGRALGVIVSGMEAGLFPARPGEPRSGERFENCGICPYDRVCSGDRARVWARKRFAHDLHDYIELAED